MYGGYVTRSRQSRLQHINFDPMFEKFVGAKDILLAFKGFHFVQKQFFQNLFQWFHVSFGCV